MPIKIIWVLWLLPEAIIKTKKKNLCKNNFFFLSKKFDRRNWKKLKQCIRAGANKAFHYEQCNKYIPCLKQVGFRESGSGLRRDSATILSFGRQQQTAHLLLNFFTTLSLILTSVYSKIANNVKIRRKQENPRCVLRDFGVNHYSSHTVTNMA